MRAASSRAGRADVSKLRLLVDGLVASRFARRDGGRGSTAHCDLVGEECVAKRGGAASRAGHGGVGAGAVGGEARRAVTLSRASKASGPAAHRVQDAISTSWTVTERVGVVRACRGDDGGASAAPPLRRTRAGVSASVSARDQARTGETGVGTWGERHARGGGRRVSFRPSDAARVEPAVGRLAEGCTEGRGERQSAQLTNGADKVEARLSKGAGSKGAKGATTKRRSAVAPFAQAGILRPVRCAVSPAVVSCAV